MEDSKKCKKCECNKLLTEFTRQTSSKDGKMSICKSCNSFYRKARYKDNPEKYKAMSIAWNRNNKEKHRARSKNWAADNPERVKANKKKNEESNPERYKNYRKNYRVNHKDKHKDFMAKYYIDNREKFKAKRKEYYKNNTEKVKEDSKNWRINNPEKYRIIKSRRRANKINRLHPDHNFDIERGFINKCRELELLYGIKYNVDHIWPLSRGGPHHHDNLQIISQSLNNQKHNNMFFIHQEVKSWMDLPIHIIQWIKNNEREQFNNVLKKLIESEKYSKYELDRLINC